MTNMKAIGLMIAVSVTGCGESLNSDGRPSDIGISTSSVACDGISIDDPNPSNPPGQCSGGFFLGDFPVEDARVIRDAGYEWNGLAKRGLVHLGADSACAIVPGELSDARIASHRDGVITIDMRRLLKSDKNSRLHYAYAIKHEIGRAMGMQPTAAASGVMSTCTSDGVFSVDDWRECRRLGLCY